LKSFENSKNEEEKKDIKNKIEKMNFFINYLKNKTFDEKKYKSIIENEKNDIPKEMPGNLIN
jgi:hypothetical protein